MRFGRPLLVAWCIGSIAGGCTSDLKLALEGKECNAQDRCVDGYACDRTRNVCVPLDTPWLNGGAGGTHQTNPAGGSGAVSSGSGGDGGMSGAPTAAGQGGLSDAGAGGPPDDRDADTDPSDAGDACVPVPVYRDNDNDGFGDVSDAQIGCPGNGWVVDGTDCRDDRNDVRPNQTAFFAEGYPIADGVSFDYDCNDVEDPSNENDTLAPAPTCNGIGGVNCIGSGFLPTEPLRAGQGVEPRCGSTVRRDCEFDTLLGECETVDTPLGDSLTFVCH